MIVARGLTKRFGDFIAVDHVDLAIGRGEIFGFVGSNGCGKTTTMKMLTGLLDASDGEALLFGRSDRGRRHRGAPARRLYVAGLFALQRIDACCRISNCTRRLFGLPARARRAIASRSCSTGSVCDDHADALAADLPLGLRQRLSLAVALVHGPDLLILDEPTSGVDPVARDEFWAPADRTVARSGRDDFHLDPFHERGGALRPHFADGFGQDARHRRARRTGRGARTRKIWKRPSSPFSRRPAAARPLGRRRSRAAGSARRAGEESAVSACAA